MAAMSRKVMGASLKYPSVTCESISDSTRFRMLSSLYSGKLLEAASTASAIIMMAVSFEKGLGPG